MEQFNVKGMSCAACSARVEKAVSKVPGVTSCTVSLLTNSMGVEGSASAESIMAAVRAAGYKASLKKGAGTDASAAAAAARYKRQDTRHLSRSRMTLQIARSRALRRKQARAGAKPEALQGRR